MEYRIKESKRWNYKRKARIVYLVVEIYYKNNVELTGNTKEFNTRKEAIAYKEYIEKQ
jgi:hypothetical protein